jgi:hypothetical protein
MKALKPIAFLAIIIFCAWAVLGGVDWGQAQTQPTPVMDCNPAALPQAYQALNGLLREFDDAMALAMNVPRDQIVDQIENLQRVQRDAEALAVQPCLADFRAHIVSYMDRVVELLVAFMGGTPPDLVFQGLTGSELLRQQIRDDVAALTGSTATPQPTPLQFATSTQSAAISIPVTGASSTASPEGVSALATVNNPDGVNLREGPGVQFNFQFVLGPGSVVPVLGTDPTRQWLYVQVPDGPEGWLFLPLVSLNVLVEDLSILE